MAEKDKKARRVEKERDQHYPFAAFHEWESDSDEAAYRELSRPISAQRKSQ